jgi:hypothetical protein
VGEPVLNITSAEYPSGTNSISIEEKTDKLKSGVYFLKIQTESFDKAIKIIKM